MARSDRYPGCAGGDGRRGVLQISFKSASNRRRSLICRIFRAAQQMYQETGVLKGAPADPESSVDRKVVAGL